MNRLLYLNKVVDIVDVFAAATASAPASCYSSATQYNTANTCINEQLSQPRRHREEAAILIA